MNSDSMDKAMTNLFRLLAEQETPPIIELLNFEQQPIGALYLDKFRNKGQLIVCSTNNRERYYLYCDGIGIFFSFYKKLQLSEDIDA